MRIRATAAVLSALTVLAVAGAAEAAERAERNTPGWSAGFRGYATASDPVDLVLHAHGTCTAPGRHLDVFLRVEPVRGPGRVLTSLSTRCRQDGTWQGRTLSRGHVEPGLRRGERVIFGVAVFGKDTLSERAWSSGRSTLGLADF